MESTEIQQYEIEEIEEFANKRDTLLNEVRKVIVGQDEVIEELLIALFAAATACSSACRGWRRRC